AETRAGGAVPEETLREIEVLERELQALLALAEGRSEAAVSLLEEATEMEESRPLEYGPPDIVKPSHELLGEILLELGRPGLAKEKFETALERAPRRALSLAGLARAAAASGDLDRATEACEELRSVRKDAVETASIPRVCGGAGGDRAG
ncbi:MAG: tetratricopeptide repeat protein, partial [Thermoanaerobaculia bacterium]|nr:tetratricopeptide repeat protein [Thermoanaerobaculia bacterium]